MKITTGLNEKMKKLQELIKDDIDREKSFSELSEILKKISHYDVDNHSSKTELLRTIKELEDEDRIILLEKTYSTLDRDVDYCIDDFKECNPAFAEFVKKNQIQLGVTTFKIDDFQFVNYVSAFIKAEVA